MANDMISSPDMIDEQLFTNLTPEEGAAISGGVKSPIVRLPFPLPWPKPKPQPQPLPWPPRPWPGPTFPFRAPKLF